MRGDLEGIVRALGELSDSELLLVVTGAGVSTASGIPTFRGSDPGAVWHHHDVELATSEYFRRDPVGQWRWYLERFASVDAALPNPAHEALRDLEALLVERGVDFLLVTQNIDCLHESAGSRRLIKVHGSSDRLRCAADQACELAAPYGSLPRRQVELERFRRRPERDTLPRCPSCGGLLRAHVLFFDEYYTGHADYRFDDVERAAATAQMVLFAGTSFAVGVTDLILRQALARHRPMVSIDPAGLPPHLAPYRRGSEPGLVVLSEPAESALPALVRKLSSVSP